MILKKVHRDFENYIKHLIDKTIIKVEYAEIDYQKLNGDFNEKPYYFTHFRNLDSIDFSIFLYSKTNEKIEIYWDDKFFQFGLGMKINEKSDFSDFKIWDVSNNQIWSGIIGETIESAKLNWEEVTTTDEKNGTSETFIYPQDISLKFSNGIMVFISAAAFLNEHDNEVFGMCDNLTVTNNEELARKTKMIN
ncbi:hypothetical protein SAMN04489761_1058 [Tenacibaculum sp. MAR_2009_124]|uniref:hypothetical protein n=1 Tax=Tenacibaculum sp. MAR_2009_124 TaxID=1250059 RepID=UPI0008968357|nr:hypothetical protein [Tenacibaculum sp. MAR_2009_124]SEB49857.1 hypothetical protein SAMN04489761_1058 [Tenacibaculum sp. MAR_2009_124]